MGNKKIKIWSAIIGAAVVLIGLWFWSMSSRQDTATRQIKVGGQILTVEIAESDFLKQKGLSARENLDANSGMLFIYSDQQIRYFWMSDMKFPLDVVWIADNKVVGMQENIPYQSNDDQIVRFQSNAPADMVLEVNAGWIARQGVKIGDAVVHN